MRCIYNEILADARMKSAGGDEIQADGLDEIKSVLPPSGGFHPDRGYRFSSLFTIIFYLKRQFVEKRE